MYKIKEAFSYIDIEDRITSLGYQNPQIDKGDSRQREAWIYIKKQNLSVKLMDMTELRGNLADHDDPIFGAFQCRVTSESFEKINEYEEQFFVENEKLKRLPFVFKIDGKYYVSIGNHRVRAVLKGYDNHPDSEFVGHCVLIDYDDILSNDEKIDIGSDIANLSNKETGDETQPETAEDIAHQMMSKYDIKSKLDSVMQKWTEEQKLEWADVWCKEWKPNTSSRKIARAKNIAFARHISQSIPFQDDERLDIEWKKYWLHSSWSPNTSKVEQKKYATHTGNFQRTMMTNFLNREEWTASNSRIQACVRVGDTMSKDVTSEEYIQEQRQAFTDFIQDWNNNVNVINSGLPIITKILFVKQTANGYYEALEWIEDQGKFVNITYEGEPKAALELEKILNCLSA